MKNKTKKRKRKAALRHPGEERRGRGGGGVALGPERKNREMKSTRGRQAQGRAHEGKRTRTTRPRTDLGFCGIRNDTPSQGAHRCGSEPQSAPWVRSPVSTKAFTGSPRTPVKGSLLV
ncbi:hypothetical protein E2C01_037301 [Portunus trituberculatus]|uniref:Uncharacterized protein n=1 Tax=Portunus trituberculatus TaxID=210409 RepID=A0A5B7FEL4_PORTR|nr:hypothetical protein [Portunus trituberculatus]